jgi:uncharacterized protein involved in outer membrane biogenesis
MRFLLGLAATLLATLVLAAVFIAVFGWNWLRAPLERVVLQKTGRELAIHGDLTVKFGWPQVRLRGATLTFANPAWTQERYMVAATSVEVAVDVPQLLQRNLTFPEVRLQQATVFLETSADGRKNWLLDLAQQDENARIRIGRIALDRAQLGYDDVARKTRLRATLSTGADGAGYSATSDLRFTAVGQYKGLAVKAQGSGGPVLALRDTTLPYPLKFEASAGRTQVKADGTLTGLLALDAIDMRMTLRGDNLEQLYPLLGIAFPATRPYLTEGHLLHAGSTWRYEQFTGRVGASDIAGFVQVVTGGKRPALTAGLTSRVLALEDLGPVIGARPVSAAQAAALPVGHGPECCPTCRSRPTAGTQWTPRSIERDIPAPCQGPAAGEPGDPPQPAGRGADPRPPQLWPGRRPARHPHHAGWAQPADPGACPGAGPQAVAVPTVSDGESEQEQHRPGQRAVRSDRQG